MITNLLISVPDDSALTDLDPAVSATINAIIVGGLYEWGLPNTRPYNDRKIIMAAVEINQSATITLQQVESLIASFNLDWTVVAAQSIDGDEIARAVPLSFVNYLADVQSNPGQKKISTTWVRPTPPCHIVINAGNADWVWAND